MMIFLHDAWPRAGATDRRRGGNKKYQQGAKTGITLLFARC
jgi:hypothetical protein